MDDMASAGEKSLDHGFAIIHGIIPSRVGYFAGFVHQRPEGAAKTYGRLPLEKLNLFLKFISKDKVVIVHSSNIIVSFAARKNILEAFVHVIPETNRGAGSRNKVRLCCKGGATVKVEKD